MTIYIYMQFDFTTYLCL